MPAAGGLQPPLLPPLASPEQSARHVVKLAFPDVKEDGAGRGGIPAHLRTAKRSMAAMDSAAEHAASVPKDRVSAIFRSYDVKVLGALKQSDAMAAISELGAMHGMPQSSIDGVVAVERCCDREKTYNLAAFLSLYERLLQHHTKIIRDGRIKTISQVPDPPPGAENNMALRQVFGAYCNFAIGTSRLLIFMSGPVMIAQQLHHLCHCIGLVGKDGPLPGSAVDIAYIRQRNPQHKNKLDFPGFLRVLAILSYESGWDLFKMCEEHAPLLGTNNLPESVDPVTMLPAPKDDVTSQRAATTPGSKRNGNGRVVASPECLPALSSQVSPGQLRGGGGGISAFEKIAHTLPMSHFMKPAVGCEATQQAVLPPGSLDEMDTGRMPLWLSNLLGRVQKLEAEAGTRPAGAVPAPGSHEVSVAAVPLPKGASLAAVPAHRGGPGQDVALSERTGPLERRLEVVEAANKDLQSRVQQLEGQLRDGAGAATAGHASGVGGASAAAASSDLEGRVLRCEQRLGGHDSAHTTTCKQLADLSQQLAALAASAGATGERSAMLEARVAAVEHTHAVAGEAAGQPAPEPLVGKEEAVSDSAAGPDATTIAALQQQLAEHAAVLKAQESTLTAAAAAAESALRAAEAASAKLPTDVWQGAAASPGSQPGAAEPLHLQELARTAAAALQTAEAASAGLQEVQAQIGAFQEQQRDGTTSGEATGGTTASAGGAAANAAQLKALEEAVSELRRVVAEQAEAGKAAAAAAAGGSAAAAAATHVVHGPDSANGADGSASIEARINVLEGSVAELHRQVAAKADVVKAAAPSIAAVSAAGAATGADAAHAVRFKALEEAIAALQGQITDQASDVKAAVATGAGHAAPVAAGADVRQVKALEEAISAIQRKVDEQEEAVKAAAAAAPAAACSVGTALGGRGDETRIKALEDSVAKIERQLAAQAEAVKADGPSTPTRAEAPDAARIKAVEDSLAALQQQVTNLAEAVKAAATASTPAVRAGDEGAAVAAAAAKIKALENGLATLQQQVTGLAEAAEATPAPDGSSERLQALQQAFAELQQQVTDLQQQRANLDDSVKAAAPPTDVGLVSIAAQLKLLQDAVAALEQSMAKLQQQGILAAADTTKAAGPAGPATSAISAEFRSLQDAMAELQHKVEEQDQAVKAAAAAAAACGAAGAAAGSALVQAADFKTLQNTVAELQGLVKEQAEPNRTVAAATAATVAAPGGGVLADNGPVQALEQAVSRLEQQVAVLNRGDGKDAEGNGAAAVGAAQFQALQEDVAEMQHKVAELGEAVANAAPASSRAVGSAPADDAKIKALEEAIAALQQQAAQPGDTTKAAAPVIPGVEKPEMVDLQQLFDRQQFLLDEVDQIRTTQGENMARVGEELARMGGELEGTGTRVIGVEQDVGRLKTMIQGLGNKAGGAAPPAGGSGTKDGQATSTTEQVAADIGELKAAEMENDIQQLAMMLGEVAGRLATMEGNDFVHLDDYQEAQEQNAQRQQFLLDESNAVKEHIANVEKATAEAIQHIGEATDALRDNIQALSDRQEEQHKLNEVIVVKLARQVDYLQTFVKEDSSL